MKTTGKSEALLSGENAQLKHDLTVIENVNHKLSEKLSRDITFLYREVNCALKVGEESKDRVAVLEGDKKATIICMFAFTLATNAITFMVVY